MHNLETFAHSPILGVGYGNDQGLAVGPFLLANVGVVGFGVFLAFILNIWIRGFRLLRTVPAHYPGRSAIFGMLVSCMTMFLVMLIGKSEASLLFLYFWILLACLVSIDSHPRRHMAGVAPPGVR